MASELSIYNQSLTDEQFDFLRNFIEKETGIKMPPSKRQMLEGRLRKRIKHLGFYSYKDYIDYVFKTNEGNREVINLIDVITTNKTEFFREPEHFNIFRNVFIPEMLKREDIKNNPLKIWSAGCSTGEEPYTILIELFECARNYSFFPDFFVYATDISTNVLKKAKKGIYEMEKVKNIPYELKKRYFLKSKDPTKSLVKVKKALRDKIFFKRLNFMDKDYNIKVKFHAIFCRNVLIYFSRENQYNIIKKQISRLVRNGYYFIGHSESIQDMDLPLKRVAPSVYKKID